MPNDRKRISVNSQLHAEISSSFPSSNWTHRKLLHRKRVIARLFLVIGLHASNMRCLYASALIPALRGKAGKAAMTAPGYAGSLSILEEHGYWVLRPFPRSRSFTVLLQNARFSMPAGVGRWWQHTPGHACCRRNLLETSSYWSQVLFLAGH
jgi:hypothetical protein